MPFQVLCFLLFVGAPVCLAYVVAGLLANVYQPLSDIWNLVRLAFFVIVALLLGFLLALVAGSCLAGIFWPLLRPFFKARDIKNGAPFHVGDRVRILAGRHKDRVVRVYSDWRDDSVRVELGEKEKEKFTDIFSSLTPARGCRTMRSTQQPPALAVAIVTGSSVARFAADAFFRRLWVSLVVRRQIPYDYVHTDRRSEARQIQRELSVCHAFR